MMTLNQAERLVRRITELLGQPAQEAQAAKLAQDYAELGRAANRRLEQCALMIEAGEELQALQLAETPPPLLDLITLLSFRQAGEWRAYCQGRNLPWVEPFFDKHVRLLNSTYGKGLAGDHPFYRDYRRAAMQNDDERALSILRVIARMNPADQNTAQELQRLEEKLVQARLEGLRQRLESGDAAAALAHLAQLESAALGIPPSHPVWQQAQLLRCQRLLGDAEALREQGSWQEAEPLVEEIKALAAQHTVLFPDPDVARFEALEAWTQGERGAFVQAQDAQRALEALEHQVRTSETRRVGDTLPPLAELQSEFALLAGKWREAERFNAALDDDLLSGCQQSCDWLQARIQQRLKRKRARVVLASVVILAVMGAAGFLFLDYTRAKQFVAQLGRLEAARHVDDTQRLIGQIPNRLKAQARLADALARAQQFVSRELEQKESLEQKLGLLEALARHDFTNGLTSVEAGRAECARALQQLAPEFQVPGRSRLAAFEERWQAHLHALQPGRNASFSASLTQLQNLVAEHLSVTNGFEPVRQALPEIQSRLAELGAFQSQPVALEETLAGRFRQLTNAVSDSAAAVGQWTELRNQLPLIQSLDEYLNTLGQLAQSPFASASERLCAEGVRTLQVSEAALLGGLLLPGQPQAWVSLTNPAASTVSFRPNEPSDQEKTAYLKLRDDRNIQDVYLYALTNNPHNPENLGKSKPILTQGKLEANRAGKRAGLVYDPKKSPDTLRFEQQVIDDWEWDYGRLAPKVSRESDAFKRLGLADLIDPNTGSYQKSILELLDRLNQDTGSSAAFRAFLSIRLFEIAEMRPTEWGCQWAPGAAAHIQKLKDLGAVNLQSGDWMVPNQLFLYETPLRKYFEQARSLALEREASFIRNLTTRACGAKFAFAGYVNSQGAVVVTRTQGHLAECWGWSARSRLPALLLRRGDDAHPWQQLDQPLCDTPLFVFLGDRRVMLEQAARSTPYQLRAGMILPPLFVGVL